MSVDRQALIVGALLQPIPAGQYKGATLAEAFLTAPGWVHHWTMNARGELWCEALAEAAAAVDALPIGAMCRKCGDTAVCMYGTSSAGAFSFRCARCGPPRRKGWEVQDISSLSHLMSYAHKNWMPPARVQLLYQALLWAKGLQQPGPDAAHDFLGRALKARQQLKKKRTGKRRSALRRVKSGGAASA